MARYNDDLVVEKLREHLEPGEELKNYAYGVKQPDMWLLVLLIALAILPGLIAVALMTKEYIVGLTDRRFIVLRVKGGKAEVQEVQSFDLSNLPAVKASTGGIFTHIRINGAPKPFIAKFHRMGMKENRRNGQEIEAALMAAAPAA